MAKKLNLGDIQKRVSSDDNAASSTSAAYREPPDYLERRIEAQSNVVKGKRERRVVYRVDPARCKIRDDHDRVYANLNEDNCRDLIEGIKVHGQEIPAIVRQLKDADGFDYELVSGARRHWVTSYLGSQLIVEVRELSDEEVFILSDEENRNREDISDYERAVKYKRALVSHYKSQVHMSERMGVSKDWLSRYLDLGDLPADIVAAYHDMGDIKVRHARELKPLLKEASTAKKILAAAKAMHEKPQAGAAVMSRLKSAARPKAKQISAKKTEYKSASNSVFMKATGSPDQGLTIVIDTKAKTSLDDWVSAIKAAWADYAAK